MKSAFASSWFIGFISLAAAAAVGGGLLLIDPPALTRLKKLDEDRVSDLQAISRAVNDYRRSEHRLPESLEQLSLSQDPVFFNMRDPLGKKYEYNARSETSYELCAEFGASNEDMTMNARSPYWRWGHGAGRRCFNLKAPQ